MFVEHKEAGEAEVKPLDEASKLLLATAAYLERHGHCQNGHANDGQGRVCVIGAMTAVAERGDIFTPAGNAACDRLERAIKAGCIPTWSDITKTAQVLAIMRRVALGG